MPHSPSTSTTPLARRVVLLVLDGLRAGVPDLAATAA